MSKARTYGGLTTLVCEDRETGKVLWTAYLTTEEYLRCIRRWCQSGDTLGEVLEATPRHE
jgi:hypothetical protein